MTHISTMRPIRIQRVKGSSSGRKSAIAISGPTNQINKPIMIRPRTATTQRLKITLNIVLVPESDLR